LVAGLREGVKFLDVASGSGALSLPAAQLGAQVTAVDISPEMIRLLKIRAEEEGLPNLEGKVMDGQALEFEDNTFDISGSQFGVMLFPDLSQALSEMVRVTRNGGKVLVVSYGEPGKVEFLTYFLHALQIVIPGFSGLPTNPPPLPFQVSKPETLQEKMAEAGLEEIQIKLGVEHLQFRTGQDMWNWVTNSNPIAVGLIADLTENQKKEVRQALNDMILEKSGANDYAILKAPVNIGIGRKSG